MAEGLAISKRDVWVKIKFHLTGVKLEGPHGSWSSPGFYKRANIIQSTALLSRVKLTHAACMMPQSERAFPCWLVAAFLNPMHFVQLRSVRRALSTSYSFTSQIKRGGLTSLHFPEDTLEWDLYLQQHAKSQKRDRGNSCVSLCAICKRGFVSDSDKTSLSKERAYVVRSVLVCKTSAERLTFSALVTRGVDLKLQWSEAMVQQQWCLQPAPTLLPLC